MRSSGRISEHSWSDLPAELLRLIFSHFFSTDDHIKFGAICKPWQSAIMILAGTVPRPIPFKFSYGMTPFLMASKGDNYTFIHPTHTSHYLHVVPELRDKVIMDSKYGWLLMVGADAENLSPFFFRPSKKQKVGLPDLPRSTCASEFSFYGLPTSSEDCVVVATAGNGCEWFGIHITKPGEKAWRGTYFFVKEEKRFLYGAKRFYISCNPVFLNGKCYCLDCYGKVAVFDLMDIQNSWKYCGEPCPNVGHYPKVTPSFLKHNYPRVFQSFVVETEGESLTVFLGKEGEIWICKFNPVTEEWTTVEDLGSNKVLYLSNGASWIETTPFQGMGNRIYLPMLSDKSNTIIFYSLSPRRFHSSGQNISLKSFCNMKYLYHSNHGISPSVQGI